MSRGEKTREGGKSVVGQILMTEAFAKINPTDPLISTSILAKHVVYYESRKRELKIRLMNEGR
jgi:hypothetical protein